MELVALCTETRALFTYIFVQADGQTPSKDAGQPQGPVPTKEAPCRGSAASRIVVRRHSGGHRLRYSMRASQPTSWATRSGRGLPLASDAQTGDASGWWLGVALLYLRDQMNGAICCLGRDVQERVIEPEPDDVTGSDFLEIFEVTASGEARCPCYAARSVAIDFVSSRRGLIQRICWSHLAQTSLEIHGEISQAVSIIRKTRRKHHRKTSRTPASQETKTDASSGDQGLTNRSNEMRPAKYTYRGRPALCMNFDDGERPPGRLARKGVQVEAGVSDVISPKSEKLLYVERHRFFEVVDAFLGLGNLQSFDRCGHRVGQTVLTCKHRIQAMCDVSNHEIDLSEVVPDCAIWCCIGPSRWRELNWSQNGKGRLILLP
ncbi:hypothetical protein BBK36DRAFT_1181980 [Trichoderma citrinoviride]|uniref:Uncharacterized protein n=1 Tax=Trichoderma citrinoviride TaxID=58853 RepID=A0A2T4B2A3_9HYPO|nr:hypothetical protein BBK36DRAFT_1181980 [Trichoderma citrinoviride]PTB63452.1 hypothetical protein BBK36DRAFT_1181980 [Trichoderma citrinoviride]